MLCSPDDQRGATYHEFTIQFRPKRFSQERRSVSCRVCNWRFTPLSVGQRRERGKQRSHLTNQLVIKELKDLYAIHGTHKSSIHFKFINYGTVTFNMATNIISGVPSIDDTMNVIKEIALKNNKDQKIELKMVLI